MSVTKGIWKALLLAVLSVFIAPAITYPAIQKRGIFEYTGDGRLLLFNTHTNEFLEVQYKDKDGRYIEEGIQKIRHFLRCRLTGEERDIDLRLIELVDYISDHFGGNEVIEVISGYRSPELNAELRMAGRGVAKRSLHMEGKAMDIRLRGVPTSDVRNYALSLHAGGVGYYRGPDFVHIDTGRVRMW
jgi:uncharacterized protein YcbK (DUF882 family)